MLNLFILASFFHVYTCQLLYEPLLINTPVLDKGTKSELQFELQRCEESLLSVKRESIVLSRNAEQLTNQMKTTRMAIMALQQQYNVTGKHSTITAYSISKYLVQIYWINFKAWRYTLSFNDFYGIDMAMHACVKFAIIILKHVYGSHFLQL